MRQKIFIFLFYCDFRPNSYICTNQSMHEYYTLRPAKALTNALERLMIAISDNDLQSNNRLLCEYRRCQDLLGYDPAKAQWVQAQHASVSSDLQIDGSEVTYFHKLNPEE